MSQPRSPHATPSGGRRGAEPDAPVADMDGAIVLDAEVLAPAAVDAVEFQQMRGGRGSALQFVDVHDIEPVVGARIIGGPIHATHRGAQREAADAPHAVDADTHGQRTPARQARPAAADLVEPRLHGHAVQRGEWQRR